MTISGSSPKACFDHFLAHLRPLFRRTIGAHATLGGTQIATEPDAMMIGFRETDGPVAVPVKTKSHGTLLLSMHQNVRAVAHKTLGFELQTTKYRYALASSLQEEAPIRWEYDKFLEDGKRHCRNHLQGTMTIRLGGAGISLKKSHLPTGWVLIEDVIRFLIVDLGVKAKESGWHDVLEESRKAFFERFSAKSSHARP